MVRLNISGEQESAELASPSLDTNRPTAGNVFGSEGFVSMLPHDQNGVFSRAVPQGVPAFPPLLFSPAFSANSPQTVHDHPRRGLAAICCALATSLGITMHHARSYLAALHGTAQWSQLLEVWDAQSFGPLTLAEAQAACAACVTLASADPGSAPPSATRHNPLPPSPYAKESGGFGPEWRFSGPA